MSASINTKVKVNDVELSGIRPRTATNNTPAIYRYIDQTVQSRLRECDGAHRALQPPVFVSKHRRVRLLLSVDVPSRCSFNIAVGPTNYCYHHRRMRRGNVFGHVCPSVCLSVCNALSFGSFDLEVHFWYAGISSECLGQGHRFKVKVTGAKNVCVCEWSAFD